MKCFGFLLKKNQLPQSGQTKRFLHELCFIVLVKKYDREIDETFLHGPNEILYFLPAEDYKIMFNIISKYFLIFNNTPPAS